MTQDMILPMTVGDLDNYEAFCATVKAALEAALPGMYAAAQGFTPERVSLAVSQAFDLERLLKGKRIRADDMEPMLDTEDRFLFAALKELRRDLAAQEGMPAYRVFTNQALLALTMRRPETASDLVIVPGIGKKTADRFGEEILAVIRENVKSDKKMLL